MARNAGGNDESYRNNKFIFGYLNSAQDSNDIEDDGLSVLSGVDLDYLALGTIRSSDYDSSGSGPKDLTKTNIVGDDFSIIGGVINYKNQSNIDIAIDSYLTPPPRPNLSYDNKKGGVTLRTSDPNWSGLFSDVNVNLDLTNSDVIAITPHDPIGTRDIFYIDSSRYNQGNILKTFQIIPGFGGSAESFTVIVDGITYGPHPFGSWQNLPFDIAMYVQPYVNHGASGESIVVDITSDLNEDGEYIYTLSSITNDGSSEVESLYSDTVTAKIANEDALGALKSYNRAVITVTRLALNEQWLYRKAPRESDFFRIAKIAQGVGTIDILDNISTSSVIDSKVVPNINFYSMSALLQSAASTSWKYIFEKDNKLWAVPEQKQDVVFFSDALEWWKWKLSSSIGFNGDFKGTENIRDNMTVSVTNTSVIATSKGIYNIYGIGTDDDPYVRIEHEGGFSVEDNTLVKANNKIYMVSDGINYEDGEWGRKLYSYDLTELKELSAVVKNSHPFINNSKTVTYMNHIGGNKLKISMSDGTMMIYHILGDGFGEAVAADESAGNWYVETASEVPQNSHSGKFGNSDRFRIDYEGEIHVSWIIDGVEHHIGALPIVAVRGRPLEMSAPANLGMDYSIRIHGNSNAILHSIRFVKEA